jgi:hypothetical protein
MISITNTLIPRVPTTEDPIANLEEQPTVVASGPAYPVLPNHLS